jgi:hypothetical protein
MNIGADRFKHLRFERSRTAGKKYDAIIEDIKTKKTQRIPFGNISSNHFLDSTGLKIYSYLDNRNEKMRKEYLEAYKKTNSRKYSAQWYSLKYLWGG